MRDAGPVSGMLERATDRHPTPCLTVRLRVVRTVIVGLMQLHARP